MGKTATERERTTEEQVQVWGIIINLKLEEDTNSNRRNNKGLSLDPQRNHQHHHQQLQSHLHIHREEEEEEQEEEEEEEQEQHGFHHQNLQQQQYLIYGRGEQQISEEPINSQPPQQNPPKKRSYFPFSTVSGSTSTFPNNSSEYARFGEKMGETQNRSSTSRLGLLRGSGGGGEIIEVQGGHIVRSTGRKDRHSKVCTAKGPRDRRVRLSAHTAIQFYDVQDRLGYDRPSKAVDWLIKKAKSAIDELAELPPWHPTATMPTPSTLNPSSKSSEQQQIEEDEEENQLRSRGNQNEQGGFLGSSSKTSRQVGGVEQSGRYMFLQNQQDQQQHQQNNSFLPPSLDSDSIADTIKSFFPMATSSSSIHFQNYSSPPDLLSRTNSQTQDLRLSLQSFQDPMFHQHHHSQHQQHHHSNPSSEQQHALFSTAFDTSGGGGSTNAWSEQQMQEMGRFQRMIAWNPNTDSSGGNGNGSGSSSGGFMFNSPPQQQQQPQPSSSQQAVQQTLFGNSPNPFFSQRGPLQSSNSPSSIRAWNNTTDPSMVSDDNQHYQNLNSSIHHHQQMQQPFASGGFGFRIPARIQGEEEHDVGASHKPPSSASRH